MEVIKNDKLEESIKFEIDHFKDECMNLYKSMLEKNINESFNIVYNKLISEIKNNIMKTISGGNMYDYSEYEKYNYIYHLYGPIHGPQNIVPSKKFIENMSVDNNGKQNINKFLGSMITEEKIVIHGKCFYNGDNTCILHEYFLTNYGRIIIFINGSQTYTVYNEFNYWIPVDYIKLLSIICCGGNIMDKITEELNSMKTELRQKITDEIKKEMANKKIIGISQKNINTGVRCEVILEMLKLMKDQLYNRKYIPLYIFDIIKENEQLKMRFETFNEEKKLFDKEKEEFVSINGENIDLIKEKKELIELRERLKIASHKIKVEQEKLDNEKKIFHETLEKFNNVNLDDLMK